MKRSDRGSAMALYAAFLALVGIPLLLVSVDLSRMMVRRVQLANAVEAACTAYANTPDIDSLRDGSGLKLDSSASSKGSLVFLANAIGTPGTMRLTQLSYRPSGTGEIDQQVLIATCSGQADFAPMMLGGRVVYQVRHTVTIKAKPGGASNWQ